MPTITTSLEDKIDNYLFGDTDINHNSQEEYNTAYTELSVTLEQNNRLLDRVEFCMHSIEQSQSISQFLSDNALSLEKVPNWMSNAGKNVGEWFKKAWEFLKQGFLRMIKAIGGFFKKFAKIFKKKKADIEKSVKKSEWDQTKADTMTVMTKINPGMGSRNESALSNTFKTMETFLNEYLDDHLKRMSNSLDNLINETLNRNALRTKNHSLIISELKEFFDEIVDHKSSRTKGNSFLNLTYQNLYGQQEPPSSAEQPISNIVSEIDLNQFSAKTVTFDEVFIEFIINKDEFLIKTILDSFDDLQDTIKDIMGGSSEKNPSDMLDQISNLSIKIAKELSQQCQDVSSALMAISNATIESLAVLEKVLSIMQGG